MWSLYGHLRSELLVGAIASTLSLFIQSLRDKLNQVSQQWSELKLVYFLGGGGGGVRSQAKQITVIILL